MPNVTPDTPDNQRGVFNPQVALSVGNVGTGVVDVGLPPNCETLIVTLINAAFTDSVAVVGDTTGFSYPGVASANNKTLSASRTWFFDVSSTLDATVRVSVIAQLGGNWAVYADAGVHMIGDAARFTNRDGSQYVIPIVPSTARGDHPPNELSSAYGSGAANFNLLAPAGAGMRYRVFSAQMSSSATGIVAILVDTVSNDRILTMGYGGQAMATFPAQGIPLEPNAGLECFMGGAVATVTAIVFFTTETV